MAALAIASLTAAGGTAAAAASRGSGAGAPAAAAGGPSPQAAAAGGTLRAWGLNNIGQLGDGTTRNRDVPVKVKLPAGTTITSARAGCFHTLALTSAGKLLAWGLNSNGQLGDGSTTDSGAPVPVSLPPGTRITAVRAGCSFSLALTSTGQVLAWGDGSAGELGDGATADSDTPVRVTLPPGTKIKAISAGNDYGLALTSTGRMLAWGGGDSGQLGDGTQDSTMIPVRVRLRPGTRVTAIAAGFTHSMALTSTGKVLGWGDNRFGELGNGTAGGFSDVPVTARMPRGAQVRGLFAGCFHTLALTAKGKVLAWGVNNVGQLGDGSTGLRHNKDTPVQVKLPKGTTVTAISAGCIHSLALTSTGKVLAWGDNSLAELGDGSSTAGSSDIPVKVKLPPGMTAITLWSGPIASHSLIITRSRT